MRRISLERGNAARGEEEKKVSRQVLDFVPLSLCHLVSHFTLADWQMRGREEKSKVAAAVAAQNQVDKCYNKEKKVRRKAILFISLFLGDRRDTKGKLDLMLERLANGDIWTLERLLWEKLQLIFASNVLRAAGGGGGGGTFTRVKGKERKLLSNGQVNLLVSPSRAREKAPSSRVRERERKKKWPHR